jgi:hypothetical protein
VSATTVAALLATQLPKESLSIIGLGPHGYGIFRLVLFVILMCVLGLVAFQQALLAVVRRRTRLSRPAVADRAVRRVARMVLVECSVLDAFEPAETGSVLNP